MRHIVDIMISRRTSTVLMTFIAVAGAIGAWVPQTTNTTTEQVVDWANRFPVAARIADALGLHAIFSSWWFLTLLAVFVLALLVATWRMGIKARRVWRGSVRLPHTRVGATLVDVVARASAEGYRERSGYTDVRVYAKHRIGVWAPTVLHVGLLISLVSGAVALGFTASGVVDLIEGQVRQPGEEYLVVESNAFARTPEIGRPLRFDGVTAESWPSGGLKEVEASLSMLEDDGTWSSYTARVNHPLHVSGLTIYVQPGDFGEAAFLIVTAPGGAESRIQVPFYNEGDPVQYTLEPFVVGDVAFDARWDPEGDKADKPLALRLSGDDTYDPVTLSVGETATIEGLQVEFVANAQWARFTVVRSPGIGMLFLGFATIGIGALMLYLWIPRQLVVQQTDDGVLYSWHAARMGRAYLSERDEILGLSETGGAD